MRSKIPVVVLAATGSVGQRFIQLLDHHPWFEVVAVTASERSEGKTYQQACNWLLSTPMPEWVRNMPVLPTQPAGIDAKVAFSALPASSAKEIEPAFARVGFAVCSNAAAYRRETDVPILLPEINADHIALIDNQRLSRGWDGLIVTNPNCSSTGMTIALKPILTRFGVKKVLVTTLQAISGAGYPGVASMDILDNIIPYISGEEEKIEWEPLKMLGAVSNNQIELANFQVSAQVNRVPVSDGHLVCLSIELEKKASPEDVVNALREYQIPEMCRDLPSVPTPAIQVLDEANRPQPRLDRMLGAGMTTSVGRVREDPIFDIRMVVLSHNTIRGAAGGSLLNAELLVKTGYIK
jgi:aspartate-semialdehyde dehydrogenase